MTTIGAVVTYTTEQSQDIPAIVTHVFNPNDVGLLALPPNAHPMYAGLLTQVPQGTGPNTWRPLATTPPALPPTTLTFPLVALAATAETPLWTPPSGKRFAIVCYQLTKAGTAPALLRDGMGGTIIAAAATGTNYCFMSPAFLSNSNGPLTIQASNGTVTGVVTGYEVDAPTG